MNWSSAVPLSPLSGSYAQQSVIVPPVVPVAVLVTSAPASSSPPSQTQQPVGFLGRALTRFRDFVAYPFSGYHGRPQSAQSQSAAMRRYDQPIHPTISSRHMPLPPPTSQSNVPYFQSSSQSLQVPHYHTPSRHHRHSSHSRSTSAHSHHSNKSYGSRTSGASDGHHTHTDNYKRHHAPSSSPMHPLPDTLPHIDCTAATNNNYDDHADSEGLIKVRAGDYLDHGRYRVLGIAGQGTFGTVLDVVDEKYDQRLALKVVRSVSRYSEAAAIEIDILNTIRRADPSHESGCVQLYSDFKLQHDGQHHVCIGTEKLGRSLYEFIKKNHYRGFVVEDVRSFAYQLIQAVAFCHRLTLIHTDLKLENILLAHSDYYIVDGTKDFRRPRCNKIRLIDFGGATFDADHHSRIINTRQYRAPEVLLGLPWSFPSDMWSVGCILVELYTGELLFGTHDDLEHLAMMEKVLGKTLPKTMTDKAVKPYRDKWLTERRREKSPKRRRSSTHTQSRHRSRSYSRDRHHYHYDDSPSRHSHRRSRSRSLSPSSLMHSPPLSPSLSRDRSSSHARVNHLLSLRSGRLRWPPKRASSTRSTKAVSRAKTLESLIGNVDNGKFLDLVRQCLEYEPKQRVTAEKALQLEFFRHERRVTDERKSAARDGHHRDRDRERVGRDAHSSISSRRR